MNCKLVCVGKLKESFYIDACAEYGKRLSRYMRLAVAEVDDERMPETFSAAETRRAIEREGTRILTRIDASDYVIALTVGGTRMDSVAFAAHLDALSCAGARTLCFVIGGSAGLSEAVLARANEQFSLSELTFPHRIARLVLLEQIYRACKIQRGETYHK